MDLSAQARQAAEVDVSQGSSPGDVNPAYPQVDASPADPSADPSPASPAPDPSPVSPAPDAAGPVPVRRVSLRQWIRDHDESWLFVVIYLGLAVGLSVFVSLFWLLAVAALHLVLECVRQAHYRDGRTNVFLHALWEVKLDVGLVLLALMLVLYIEVVLGLLGLQSAARAAAVTRAGARIGTRAAAWERNIRTFLLTVDEMVRIVYAAVMLRKRGQKGEGALEGALPPRDGEGEGVAAELDAAGRAAEAAAERKRKAEEETERKAAAAREAERVQAAEAERVQAAEAERSVSATVADPDVPAAWRVRWGVADRIGVALVAIGLLLIVAAPLVTPHDWGSAAGALLGELRPFPK